MSAFTICMLCIVVGIAVALIIGWIHGINSRKEIEKLRKELQNGGDKEELNS